MVSPWENPVNKSLNRIRSPKGQALVEYTLLLVVVIGMALLLANRIFKPVQKWMAFYVGEYVECLLDQSELPGLGGPSGIKECDFNNPFEDVNNSKNNANKNAANSNKNKSSDTDSNSGKGSGRSGQILVRPNGQQSRIRVGGLDNDGENGKTTVVEEAKTRDSAMGYLRINKAASSVRYSLNSGSRVRGLNGLLEAEREKLKKREEKISKVANLGEEVGDAKAGKKLSVNDQIRRRQERDVELEGFSLGKFFRLFLIIAIAIALILFVGGQLAQISKSMEK